MTFWVRIGPRALREIDGFADYTADYSEEFALAQIERLAEVLNRDLGETPLRWAYFWVTGAPYRAYLFRVGRRTHYWIIYAVDEETRTVDVLRFWNALRDPDSLDL